MTTFLWLKKEDIKCLFQKPDNNVFPKMSLPFHTMQTNVDHNTIANRCELQNANIKIIMQQTNDVNQRHDFKRTFVQKKDFLVTLANINVSLNHDFPSQFCSVSHIFGNILMVELRRILNVFFNNLNTIFSLKCQ